MLPLDTPAMMPLISAQRKSLDFAVAVSMSA
jgi:hypothetical protein